MLITWVLDRRWRKERKLRRNSRKPSDFWTNKQKNKQKTSKDVRWFTFVISWKKELFNDQEAIMIATEGDYKWRKPDRKDKFIQRCTEIEEFTKH